MPNRQLINGEPYRYAYQGQEKDPETGKEAFQLRLWDGRIGRWLTTDPYGQHASPYMGMGNNPIRNIDPDGGLCVDADGKSIPCPDGYGSFAGPTVDTGVFDNGKFVGYGLDEITITSSKGIQPPANIQSTLFINTTENLLDNSQVGIFSSFLSLAANDMYDEKGGSWRGKNGKYYGTDWGGNGATGGKYSYAKSTGKFLNRAGGIFGAIGIGGSINDKINGKISTGRFIQDNTFNVAGYLGPVGTAASFGYGSGSMIEDWCNCNIQINWRNVRKHGFDLHKMFEPLKGRDY